MNFDLNDEQRQIAATARAFAQKEMAPFAAEWDANSHFPVDVIRKAGELGFCALYCPPELGGMGLPRLDATLVFEELAAACTSTTAFITIHNMATWMASTFGSTPATNAAPSSGTAENGWNGRYSTFASRHFLRSSVTVATSRPFGSARMAALARAIFS